MRKSLANQWVEEMVRTHERRLLRFLTRMVPISAAREIAQEAFLKMLSQDIEVIKKYPAEWLFTVCRNSAHDFIKRDRFVDRQGHALELVAVDPAPLPCEKIGHDQQLMMVQESIGRLPAVEQEVVRLKFQEGFSYKEISRITGHSISYVGVLIHQAIQKVRKDLSISKGVKNETGT